MKNTFKKILITIITFFSVAFTGSVTSPQPVHAADGLGSCRDFLGMTSWDCGIDPNANSQDDLSNNIWTIAFNVFVDIGILATYLIIAYVIYGGYLYMFSSGDPGKAMAGKKTLTNAFIGLAIVMLANIILSTIRTVLIGNSSFQDCAITECVDPSALVNQLINWFIGVSGFVAVIFVVVGGVGYMTSRGDPGRLQKAKSTILYALIGLIIVALSWAITTFVYNIIKNNSDYDEFSTSFTQNYNIAHKTLGS